MTTARKVLGLIAEGYTQESAARKSGISPSWATKLLNDAGTNYYAARQHFRKGGTVDMLLQPAQPAYPEGTDAEWLQRIDARLQRLESTVGLIAVRLGVRP